MDNLNREVLRPIAKPRSWFKLLYALLVNMFIVFVAAATVILCTITFLGLFICAIRSYHSPTQYVESSTQYRALYTGFPDAEPKYGIVMNLEVIKGFPTEDPVGKVCNLATPGNLHLSVYIQAGYEYFYFEAILYPYGMYPYDLYFYYTSPQSYYTLYPPPTQRPRIRCTSHQKLRATRRWDHH